MNPEVADLIRKILTVQGVSPDLVVGEQTAFNILEGYVMAAFDDIEEVTWTAKI